MTKLDDRIERLERQIGKANNGIFVQAMSIIRDLQAETRRLREALGFYGDEKKYAAQYQPSDIPIDNDNGKIARAALKEDGDG